jgi:hypothetical protein
MIRRSLFSLLCLCAWPAWALMIGGVDHTMQREAHEIMAFDDASMRAQAPDAPEYFAVLAKWLAHQTR